MLETAASSVETRCLPTVPTPVSVEVATFQTDAGNAAIDDETEVIAAPRDEDAVVTMLFVFAFTTAAIEDEAVSV